MKSAAQKTFSQHFYAYDRYLKRIKMVVGRNKHVGTHTNTYPFATTATPRLRGAELCKQGGSSGSGGWWFVCVDSGRTEMGPVSRNLLGRDRPHHHNPGNLAQNLHRVPGGGNLRGPGRQESPVRTARLKVALQR